MSEPYAKSHRSPCGKAGGELPAVPTGYAELDQALGADKPFNGKRVTIQTQWIGGEGANFDTTVAAFEEAFRRHAQGRRDMRALFLGGGGYTLPRLLEHEYPGVVMDVVEIDPRVTGVARNLLGIADASRIRSVNQDARWFLRHLAEAESYDVVFADACATEEGFEFEYEGATIVGFIDRIGPDPAGFPGMRITDYKTGSADRDRSAVYGCPLDGAPDPGKPWLEERTGAP